MTRKLIAVDVDGTLINDRLELTRHSVELLKRILAEGHLLVLASGRPYRAMKPYYDLLGLKTPLICYNGAHVFDPQDPSFIELKRTFPQEAVKDIAFRSQSLVTSFMCESEKRSYLLREDDYLNHYFPYQQGDYVIGQISDILHEDVYTMLYRSSHENVAALQKIVEAHPGIKYRHWTSSFYSEAYLEGVSKGSALSYIINRYGFAKEDIYAYGDSDNDFEMLQLAGHPFALNSCKSSLLRSTFPQTKNGNNQDGVAVSLAEELLKL
jgi:5-amino-6-(5-phospho-D-ribitylamino)uracil phosphatase